MKVQASDRRSIIEIQSFYSLYSVNKGYTVFLKCVNISKGDTVFLKCNNVSIVSRN